MAIADVKFSTVEKKAAEILIGAGVIVDKKKKIQTWLYGMKVTKKIAKAGGVLDSVMKEEIVKGKVTQVPEWKTRWMNQSDFNIELYRAKKERDKNKPAVEVKGE
jgi:hypothetical protein